MKTIAIIQEPAAKGPAADYQRATHGGIVANITKEGGENEVKVRSTVTGLLHTVNRNSLR